MTLRVFGIEEVLMVNQRLIGILLLVMAFPGLALAGPGAPPQTDSSCYYDSGLPQWAYDETNSNYWAVGFCRTGLPTRGRVTGMSAYVGNNDGAARVLRFAVYANGGGRPGAFIDTVRTSVSGNNTGQWYSVASNIPVTDTFYVAAWPSSSQTNDIFLCWDASDNAPSWTQWHSSGGTWLLDATVGDIMIRCDFIDHDVGLTQILSPVGGTTIDSGQTLVIPPSCITRNFGTETESYAVRMRIGARYDSAVTVSNLARGGTQVLNFPNWTALERGALTVKSFSTLGLDYFRDNDTQTLASTVFVRVYDAAVTAITGPSANVDSGVACQPKAKVKNVGNADIASWVKLVYSIDDGYTDAESISSLGSGVETELAFANWTPRRRGTYHTTVTSQLVDSNPTNNQALGTGFVRVVDIGPTAIVAPPDTVDSGSVRAVIARVKNFGNVSVLASGYTVKFGIGDGYLDSQTPPTVLNPGESLEVSFRTWQPGVKGRFSDSAYTLLTGDMNPANDKQTDSVTVVKLVTRDAGVVGIIAPTPIVDSGITSPVKARVKNFGSQTLASFDVRFRIGSDVSRSQTVLNLPPDSSREIVFADWTATTKGYTPVCCSILTADQNPGNDFKADSVFTAVHDAGATSILAPVGVVDSGVSITPTMLVNNFGNIVEWIPARLTIGADYSDIESTRVLPGYSGALSFAVWTATARGPQAIKCSTRLVSDVRDSNDAVLGNVQVRLIDVGPTAIQVPSGNNVPRGSVTPRITLHNFGNTTQTVPAEIAIFHTTPTETTRIYFDTGYAMVSPGGNGTASSDAWAANAGNYKCHVRTFLDGDNTPANDTLSNYFTVVEANRDVGMTAVIAPVGVNDTFPVIPVATIRNYGSGTENCYAHFRIKNSAQAVVYLDSALCVNLGPGGSASLGFPAWTGHHPPGSYTEQAFTALLLDANRSNDTAPGSFTVIAARRDAQAVAIVAPFGVIDTLAKIPMATVRNSSDLTATFYARFLITDAYAVPVYVDSALCVNLGPAQTTTLSFMTWGGTHAPGSYNALCVTLLAGDANPGNDTARGQFQVSASAPPEGWVRMTDLPQGFKKKNIKDGGALAYGKESGNDTAFVYAFKGNGTYEFYRYNVLTNAWVSRDSIPALNRNLKKKGVKKGSSFVMGTNGKLYATKGNGTCDFWEYDPQRPTGLRWIQKADVPTGSKACREGVGAAAVKAYYTGSDSDFVYLLKGSGTCEFYRYNVQSNTWDLSLPAAPTGMSSKPFKNGSCLTSDGLDAVYCLKGSYNEFFIYSISGRTWETRDTLPKISPPGTSKKKVKDGAGIAYCNQAAYVLKGGNTNEFWKYDCNYRHWFTATALTAGIKKVKGGGALVYGDAARAMFALRGNNTREFWMYNGLLAADRCPRTADRYPLTADRQSNSSFDIRHSSLRIAPNPFMTATAISYSLPRAGNISLKLYDVTGKLVSTLASGYHPAGDYAYRLSPTAYRLSAGIYVLRLESQGCATTSKLIIE
jgi:hypothetical protein